MGGVLSEKHRGRRSGRYGGKRTERHLTHMVIVSRYTYQLTVHLVSEGAHIALTIHLPADSS